MNGDHLIIEEGDKYKSLNSEVGLESTKLLFYSKCHADEIFKEKRKL
eukprot:gene1847-988_t